VLWAREARTELRRGALAELMRSRRLPLLVAALVATAAAACACTDVQGTNGKDFVTGDGVVVQIDASDRGKPVAVAGESLTGEQLTLADLRGGVVVVNVWGAWCTECRAEAPLLVAAAGELSGIAEFVGIDVRDSSQDNARAYERGFGVGYPSIWDPGSTTLLDFPTPYNPRDIPTTMVLDREGRLAALIRGALPSKLTLVQLVQKVADEPSASGSSDG
jgi:thiol-disulfide isomerase/thioredoxin